MNRISSVVNRRIVACAVSALILVAFAVEASANSWKSRTRSYAVTITNLTKGQVLTPPVVASHSRRFQLFAVGDVADEALYTLAETGGSDLLVAQLQDDPAVADVAAADGPIMPGQSLTVYVEGSYRYPEFTALGMLAGTNDAFFALQGARLSPWSSSTNAIAYDAGSEANNESCDYVPGPPCGGSGARMTDGAEGFIHVANGVHGIADLLPEVSDWRSPAARIQVQLADD